jgi:hypothetical protein
VASSPRQCLLVKVSIDGNARYDDLSQFDKKILITRDPRDTLVSRVVSTIYNRAFAVNRNKADAFLECIERKRKHPRSVSVIEILTLLQELSGNDVLSEFAYAHNYAYAFGTVNSDYCVYRYEDFCARRGDGLEEYLGFKISYDEEVDPALRRVARTKSVGDWKHWFTESDIDHFQPLYHEYLVRYGYDLNWRLCETPTILPEHSTEYVRQLIREQRKLSRRLTTAWRRIRKFVRERCLR